MRPGAEVDGRQVGSWAQKGTDKSITLHSSEAKTHIPACKCFLSNQLRRTLFLANLASDFISRIVCVYTCFNFCH